MIGKLVGGLVAIYILLNAARNQYPNEIAVIYREDARLGQLGLTNKPMVEINGKRVHGRFLHITDLHPDPYYVVGSSPSEQCHSGSKSDEVKAGKYGDAILGCDSPMLLMNKTIEWISDNLADKIDFIVWTGDNIRHDNDRRYPRTEDHIFNMNQLVADLMIDHFPHIPIIPSIGNNDVYPHNLFSHGSTLQTREFYKIWKNFIPQSQLHVFNKGVYFFKEVIPGNLAVISLNTLYLFKSNPLVDNCDSKKQPGHELFLWLGYVLKELRKQNMKVWLTGHVPPNEKNYDISCWRKYVAWTHEYRDVIIGGLYGHMNIDHFIPLDSNKAYKSIKKEFKISNLVLDEEEDEHIDVEDNNSNYFASFGEYQIKKNFETQGGVPNNKVGYMESLRRDLYAKVKGKKKSGAHLERYSIAHVGSSIVPTFNPGFRIWEYNISDVSKFNQPFSWDSFFMKIDHLIENLEVDDDFEISKKKKKHKKKKPDKTFPPQFPKHNKLGPAYTPQFLSPEKYVQYYLDLESVNKGDKHFEYEIEYKSNEDPFYLPDLTVSLWLQLARNLGKPTKSKFKDDKELKKLESIWKYFLKFSFVSSDYENKNYG